LTSEYDKAKHQQAQPVCFHYKNKYFRIVIGILTFQDVLSNLIRSHYKLKMDKKDQK